MIARLRAHLPPAVLGLLVLLVAAPALAQTTGGSFGGGDWSGGGWSGGGGRSSSDDDGAGMAWLLFDLVRLLLFTVGPVPTLVIVVIVVAVWLAVRPRPGKLRPTGQGLESVPRGARAWARVDITALRIAIDWRARRTLQDRLTEIARTADTRTKRGLVRVLQASIDAVEGTKIAWLYWGASNFHPMSPPEAQRHFLQLAQAARANFESELVRNASGKKIEQQAPELRARAHEGEGVVVVTLIVAARVELMDLHSPEQLVTALRALRRIAPGDLVAIEVVWSPAADDDRMSTLEMEARYPELRKIDESAIGGRVFCGYCRGPYPAELGACPHCGAPSASVR